MFLGLSRATRDEHKNVCMGGYINTSMMQNFGLEDLSHVQSRRNLLKYLVQVEMASDWFTRIYLSILAEQISSKIKIWCAN